MEAKRRQGAVAKPTANRRIAYDAAFKLKVVREALKLPEHRRIKPTCREYQNIEPVCTLLSRHLPRIRAYPRPTFKG